MKIEGSLEVVYSAEAHHKMYAYARAAKGEVTGFGQVHQQGNRLYVDDVYIIPQKATAAGVHVDADTLHEFMAWCRKTKRKDRLDNLRLWWHSHVDMECFRSGTDRQTCELLLQVMPWLLCVVVNKKGQHETTLHLKDPTRVTFCRPKVWTTEHPYVQWTEQCTAEVKAMVGEWHHIAKEEPKPVKVYTPMIPSLPSIPNMSAITHDYYPTSGLFGTGEEVYLDALEQGRLQPKESQWDRYRREKGLYVPEDLSVFKTDGKTDDEIRLLPFHEMTDAQMERYALMYEETHDHETKRIIVEEGIPRHERTSEK